MASLQAASCSASGHWVSRMRSPWHHSKPSPELSARLPGFSHAEVCRRSLFFENTQYQGTWCRGGLLSLQATARPIGENQEPLTETVPTDVNNISMDVLRWIDAFHRFTRPHTIIGTAIGIISISLLAIQNLQDFSSRFAVGLAQALIPALLMNVYIVGLNQIFDIEIDKINKPTLPLASGEFSLSTGISIVTISAILSFAMGAYIGSQPLLWALSVSFILGTAYSIKLPWLRWKRSAFAAATCILSVRAVIVQLAFYLHVQSFVFGRAAVLTRPLVFATGFMCFFSVVIALFKDIPDLEGDEFFGIQSYTVQLGQERVFWMCIQLLLGAYGVATLVGATSEMIWLRMAMVLGHTVLGGVLWHNANQINLKSKGAITGFYMFVWKLFYAEYLLIPLMR